MAQTIETEEWITLKFSDPEYREAIMASGGYCQECDGQDMLGVHHVIYRSQGGENLRDNYRVLCHWCHDVKHDIRSR